MNELTGELGDVFFGVGVEMGGGGGCGGCCFMVFERVAMPTS